MSSPIAQKAEPVVPTQRGQPSVFGRFTRIRNSILARPVWLTLGRWAKTRMKIGQMGIAALLIAFLASCVTSERKSAIADGIVGTWSGADPSGAEGKLVLSSDGTADFIVGGESIAKTIVRDRGLLKYQLDNLVSPAHLDFFAEIHGGGTVILHSIVEFRSPTVIKWRIALDGSQPRGFENDRGEDKGMILRKVNGE